MKDGVDEYNRHDLKEMAIYYGGWDKLREVIHDLEVAEAESNWESFVEDYYGADKPFTMAEQQQAAQKLKRG